MPKVTFDTLQLPNGAWSYRLFHGTRLLTQSGGFLFQRDAEVLGRHFADDPVGVLAFFEDRNESR